MRTFCGQCDGTPSAFPDDGGFRDWAGFESDAQYLEKEMILLFVSDYYSVLIGYVVRTLSAT